MSDVPIINRVPPSPIEVEKELAATQTAFLDTKLGRLEELLDESNELAEDQIELEKDIEKERKKEEKEPRTVNFGEKAKEVFDKLGANMGKQAEELGQVAVDMALGPLQLITKPLESFFGFGVLDILKGAVGIGKKVGTGLFGTGEAYKGTLKESDIREVDPGAVYLANKLEEEEDLDEKKGFLASLLGGTALGGIASKILPGLMKAAPIAALIGGLLWGVIDAFKGARLAEEWGVGKLSGILGAFFAGPGEGGLMDAFKGMGKWALIGAGIGSIVPGVGTILGGIIGAVFGGILGWIGGKRLAQAFQAVGDWFVQAWSDVVDFFKDAWAWVSNIGERVFRGVRDFFVDLIAWDSEDSIFKNLARAYINLVTFVPRTIIGWVGSIFTGIGDFFRRVFSGEEDTSEMDEVEKGLIGRVGDIIVDIGRNLFGFIGDIATRAWRAGRGFVENAVEGIIDFFKDAFDSVKGFITDIPDRVLEFVTGIPENLMKGLRGIGDFTRDHVWPGIKNFFGRIFETMGDLLSGPIDFLSNLIQKTFDSVSEFVSKPFDFAKDMIERVIGAVTGFFQGIGNFFGFVGDMGIFDLVGIIARGDFAEAQAEWVQKREAERGTREVNDAIITPTGEIIHTHPDDTIIATKNTPERIRRDATLPQFNNEIAINSEEIATTIKDSSENNTKMILDSLERLIAAVQDAEEGRGMFVSNNFASRFEPQNIIDALKVAY